MDHYDYIQNLKDAPKVVYAERPFQWWTFFSGIFVGIVVTTIVYAVRSKIINTAHEAVMPVDKEHITPENANAKVLQEDMNPGKESAVSTEITT